MKQLPRILFIDDSSAMTAALAQAMHHDHMFEYVHTGKLGLYRADREPYDVIILDLNLADLSGIDVCHELRERDIKTPVLILSAEAGPRSKIAALDAGANDYLTKPFSLGELKARLRVLIRDTPSVDRPLPCYRFSELELNAQMRLVTRQGEIIPLRRKEFALLERLMMQPNMVISRAALSEHAWGDPNGAPWTNTIDVHMKHLRDKIDRPFGSSMIKTVHGVGYRLVAARPVYALESGY